MHPQNGNIGPDLPGFAHRLRAGGPVFAAWIGSTDSGVVDVLLREAFDCAVLDWQHGAHDESSLSAAIFAASAAGKPALVRSGVELPGQAARYLDWGAAGIIAPMIDSVADAERFVQQVKFPPIGGRSWGPGRAMRLCGLNGPDYLAHANSFTLAIAMIETRAGLAACADILNVEGIDGVLVGPSDLSISLSDGRSLAPEGAAVEAALGQVLAAARHAGKFACAFCGNGARARALVLQGYALVSVAADMLLLTQGARAELTIARG